MIALLQTATFTARRVIENKSVICDEVTTETFYVFDHCIGL